MVFRMAAGGEIRIELQEQPDHQVTLTVEDNGVGIESEPGWQEPGSLGFRLVRMLAEQLGGKLEMRPRDPTRVSAHFVAR